MAPLVARHWEHVLGAAPLMPPFRLVGDTLRAALRAQREGTATAPLTLLVPDWPSAHWFAHLQRAHVLFRYPAGAACLRHPEALHAPVLTKHPLLVAHVPAGLADPAPAMSKAQRRSAARCALAQ